MRRAMLALLLTLCLTASVLADTRMMVVTDLHYLAPALYAGSSLFLRALESGDGKLTQHGEELLAALEAEAAHQRPDALLVTGDMTFNGERESHELLAAAFARIEAAGTPVWVLPGNHDIRNPSARAYGEGVWMAVPAVDPDQFREIYRDFLPEEEAGEAGGFSGRVEVSDRLWLALVDGAVYRETAEVYGVCTGAHLAWMEGLLAEAEAAGAEVVTASHHNLLPHSSLAAESYVLRDGERLAALLRSRGCRLHLSGHLHIQHIAEEEGIVDAATGGFCITPHRYALVTLSEGGTLAYAARALCPEHLPEGFGAMSEKWFTDIARRKSEAQLASSGIPQEERETMADFSAHLNLAYFTGTLAEAEALLREDPGAGLWERWGTEAFGAYLRSLWAEGEESMLTRVLPPPASDEP